MARAWKPVQLDQALLFQRLQMAHDAVGRFDVKAEANFANRRAIAPALDLFADELVDFALAFVSTG